MPAPFSTADTDLALSHHVGNDTSQPVFLVVTRPSDLHLCQAGWLRRGFLYLRVNLVPTARASAVKDRNTRKDLALYASSS